MKKITGNTVVMVLTGLLLFLNGRPALGASEHSPSYLPKPVHSNQDSQNDVLPGFKNPPPGYGEVAFYWWVGGDPLTKERLEWQLDRLAHKGMSGLQINYAHSHTQGWPTYPTDPPLFSERWWDLVVWFEKEARKRGMAISLSDYTLGVGKNSAFDEAIRKHPEITGNELASLTRDLKPGEMLSVKLNGDPLVVRAYPLTDGRVRGEGVDLLGQVQQGTLTWQAPAESGWRVVAVWPERHVPSMDPMHPISGRSAVEAFFQPFEDHMPGEGGKGLNYFFSDELEFRVHGWLWNDTFRQAFRERKGYDIVPELPHLFTDVSPRSPKVRLDYNDVVVALSEENYFKPVYDWHQQRGMTYGCDHGGRGYDVMEFGDYFRTQRWNQGPGSDQPHLSRDLIKAKVASSIAHLNRRPRVWLEGFYSSGWGTSSGQVADATLVNFLHGYNLLTLHGLYYTTRGGWWEWAPPCNHFRQPYWEHMGIFLKGVERLSYLTSQGHHVCDVAIMYPVAPMEAFGRQGGQPSVDAAFGLGNHLYNKGWDFDFMDFQSLAQSAIQGGRLQVAGESYRVLVLPAMRAVRHSTLEQAAAFARAGGIVIALGALPEASDRLGLNDPEVERLLREIFGVNAQEASKLTQLHRHDHSGGGVGLVVKATEEIEAFLKEQLKPDVTFVGAVPPAFQHRRVGERDVYALYGAAPGMEASFRAAGRVELWDHWTGGVTPLPVLEQKEGVTRLRLPGQSNDLQLVVFSAGKPMVDQKNKHETMVAVEGPWVCEPKPTMDNRFGDYRWPASAGLIGVEAVSFRYMDEAPGLVNTMPPATDDSRWRPATWGYGDRLLRLGPISNVNDVAAMDARLASASCITNGQIEKIIGGEEMWQPYAFSWQMGVEGDFGEQGYHGLKGAVSDEFIRLGKLHREGFLTTSDRQPEPKGSIYYLWTTVMAPRAMEAVVVQGGGLRPSALWINGQAVPTNHVHVPLVAGCNRLLLRYNQHGTGHFLLAAPGSPAAEAREESIPKPMRVGLPVGMCWNSLTGIMPFDTRPDEQSPAGWYTFPTPPGMKVLKIKTDGAVRCWVGGIEITGRTREGEVWFKLDKAMRHESRAFLRIAQSRGSYSGAAFKAPVAFECGQGELELGDWARVASLSNYSGGMWYRKNIPFTREQAGARTWLDLGEVVSSVELRVNGKPVGVRVAPPWRFELTGKLRSGDNTIEALVYSTLGNHYQTIPTSYPGQTRAGLLGPVQLMMEQP